MTTKTIQVTATDNAGRTIAKNLTITISNGVEIGTISLPVGYVGNAYSYTFSRVTGKGYSPYVWSLDSAITGLTLASATGILSGIPTVKTTNNRTISVIDSAGVSASGAIALIVAVYPTIEAPTNIGQTLNEGYLASDMDFNVTSGTGYGTMTWSATGLPTGLTIAPSTGIVSGTPTTNGSYASVITVTDENGKSGTYSYTFSVVVASPALYIFGGIGKSPNPEAYIILSDTGELALTGTTNNGQFACATGVRGEFMVNSNNVTMKRFTNNGLASETKTVPGALTENMDFAGSIGYAIVRGGGLTRYIYKTTDYGATWNLAHTFTQTGSWSNVKIKTCKTDSNYAWIYDGSDILILTKNGGSSWSSVDLGIVSVYDFDFISSTIGFAILTVPGNLIKLYKTIDSGSNWSLVSQIFGDVISTATIVAINESIILAAIYGMWTPDPNGNLYRSTNGGSSWIWSSLPQNGMAIIASKGFSSLSGTIINIRPAGVWKSTDSGATWGDTSLGWTPLLADMQFLAQKA